MEGDGETVGGDQEKGKEGECQQEQKAERVDHVALPWGGVKTVFWGASDWAEFDLYVTQVLV